MGRKPSPKPQHPYPTDAELAILRVLWERGASSVREVLAALNAARPAPLAYTTVLRFLQIMTEKRLVVRADRDRAHVYAPAISAERTKKQMVADLLERAFGGSVPELVLQALGARKVSPAELCEIRKLLNELDRKP
jgi:predicted transcriptional regulator